MKAIVVTESWFGNTRTIGEEITKSLVVEGIQVELLSIDNAPEEIPADVALLVIGAPTHNRGLSTVATREKAASTATDSNGEYSTGTTHPGVREWLRNTAIQEGLRIAIFDTVTAKNWLSGSAAKAAAKIVRSRAPKASLALKSFVVGGTKGPLMPGEIESAHHWVTELTRD